MQQTISGVFVGPKTITKLREVFEEIDTDGSGTVSFAEFSQACQKVSIEVGEDELKDFKKSDVSGDDELSFEEFCTFYISRLRSAFDTMDVDKSGQVGAVELKSAIEGLGFKATLREVRLLLLQVDKDRDEAVNLEEFCNFFCFLPSPDIRAIMQQWTSGLSIDTGSVFTIIRNCLSIVQEKQWGMTYVETGDVYVTRYQDEGNYWPCRTTKALGYTV